MRTGDEVLVSEADRPQTVGRHRFNNVTHELVTVCV